MGSEFVRAGSVVLSRYGTRASIQAAAAIANFVLSQAAARVLGVGEFGLYSLVLAGNALVLVLCFQPITDGINRFLDEAVREGQRDELQRAAVSLMFIAAGTVSAVYVCALVFAKYFGLLPAGITFVIACGALAYILVISFGAVAVTYFNAKRSFGWYFFTGCVPPLARALRIFALNGLIPTTTFSVIAIQLFVWTLSFGIVLSIRVPRMRALVKSLIRPPEALEATVASAFIGYISSLPLLSLATYVFMFGDRVLVAQFFTLREVGQYSYMFLLTTSVVVAVYSIYATATYLKAIEQMSLEQTPAHRSRVTLQFVRLSLAFPLYFLPLLVIYMFFDQEIVRFVFGPAAFVPSGCLALLLISAALNYGAHQLSMVGYLLKHQQRFAGPRWALIGLLIVALTLYHPSLYAVSGVVLSINAAHLLIVGVIVYQMYTNETKSLTQS